MKFRIPTLALFGFVCLGFLIQAWRIYPAPQLVSTSKMIVNSDPRVSDVNAIAESYVKLVLAMGQYDPDYVDAYYGPPEWKSEAAAKKLSLDVIATEATRLRESLEKISAPGEEIDRLRQEYLTKQLTALEARVRIVKGERMKFDEESRALYDAVAPAFPE